MTVVAIPSPRKLPVWQTVAACYATVARNLGQLLRIGWLWLLVVAGAHTALYWVELGDEQGLLLSLLAVFAGVSVTVLEFLFLASIAVAWHRLILRQERVTGLVHLRLDRTVWLYLIYSLLLTVLVAVPIALSAVTLVHLFVTLFSPALPGTSALGVLELSFAGGFILLVSSAALFLLVLPRLSLVLPAVALQWQFSLRDAWRLSRANTLRLALATLLCMLPGILLFLGELIAYVRAWTSGEGLSDLSVDSFGYRVLVPLAYAALTIFAVTLLSLTYRFFMDQGGEGAPRA